MTHKSAKTPCKPYSHGSHSSFRAFVQGLWVRFGFCVKHSPRGMRGTRADQLLITFKLATLILRSFNVHRKVAAYFTET
jgi:hypothetical protein